MKQAVKEFLDRVKARDRKALMWVGAAICVVGLAVALWPSSGRQRSGAATAPIAPKTSASRGEGKAGEGGGGALQFGEVSAEMFNVRVQQYIEQNERWKKERHEFESKMLQELGSVRDSLKGSSVVEGDVGDLRLQLRNIADQLEALQGTGLQTTRGSSRSQEVGPLQLIPVPSKKKLNRGESVTREAEAQGTGTSGRLPATRPRASADSLYYLPPGSMVKATLLNGVEAPPATQGPGLPVLLMVRDSFIGPNAYTIPMQGCMALGRADGDLSSERVKIAMILFSCVFPGGRTLDRTVQGYVSGDDGKLGIRGKVHDRRGRKLGMAVLAGFTAGLSQALGQSEVTRVLTAEGTEKTILSGSSLTFGMSQALAAALAEVTNFYRQEIQRLFPVIEVQAGVDVTLVLEQGVDIPEVNNLFSVEIERVSSEQ